MPSTNKRGSLYISCGSQEKEIKFIRKDTFNLHPVIFWLLVDSNSYLFTHTHAAGNNADKSSESELKTKTKSVMMNFYGFSTTIISRSTM